MLLFRSEEDVEDWCLATGRPRGAVVAPQSLARLAQRWYGDRLDPGWRPRTRDESQAILAATGLTGPFWELP
ncbi:MAG: hypothetical protein QOF17_16 [Solirubrobacteraceae bacterium]|nr:hypothetical protein [Solirubrobacteraceae bacterium]